MRLLIDTTERDYLVLVLSDGDKQIASLQKRVQGLSEHLLLELAEFLKKHQISLKHLTGISVHPGPGGFSSTRTGVATANALAYALGIRLTEYPSGTIKDVVLPLYDKLPHITKPKKKP